MDAEMQVVIARLDGITRRMDDAQELSYQRHEENMERFRDLGTDVKAVETEARKTNGRLATVEAEIRGIWQRIKTLGRGAGGEGEDQHITLRTVGIWVGIIGVTVTATIWFVVTVLHWGPKP